MQNRLLFFFSLIFSAISVCGQISLNDVETNLNKNGQEKIHEFLINQQENGIETFEEIKPSMKPDTDIKGYLVRENVYQINKDIDDVWNFYLNTNPCELWHCKKVNFGFLFSKKEDKVEFCNDNLSKIDTGTVVYLNLSLLSGLKKLATAFEFINIDEENKIIEFSYLSGNESIGKQRIKFYKTAKGHTRILHTSFYRTNSFLKNYFLYPYFHTRITNQFHRNIKKMIFLN